ncbi:CvpA family protein [Thiohalobacter sp. IOR34]|uniref:CvpA family protein n=1 Tax=Thiohalobacter sp. IOR34 TaxID=3057176 RepID=UPI0025B05954|nr:CvpA family protein [Thiohalobacter sp. IOR34]WJW74510.1 CvpA family protein [Thiohalobacter sp. IOR34]
MNWADYSIIAIIAISAVLSLMRGFVKESLSLLAWVAAFWVALGFSGQLAGVLTDWISVPSVRAIVAFGVLFVAVLLLGGLINFLIGQLVEKTGLSGTDRLLGTVFGVVRGVLIVAILVLLAGMTVVPQDPWWRDSQLLPHFEALALWLRDFLPLDIADNIRFD